MKTNYCLLALIGILATGYSKQSISEPQMPLRKTNSVVVETIDPVLAIVPKSLHINKKEDEAKIRVIEPIKSSALGRIWTSIDGRTIEGELLARTEDSIKIRRNCDHKEFSLPIKNISGLDRNHVINSATPLTVVAKVFEAPVKVVPQFNEAALTALKSSIPEIPPIAPLDGNDQNLINYFARYKSSIKSISSASYDAHIKSIRNKINADVKKLTPTSQTIIANPPVYDSNSGKWSAGSGAWKEVWAARSTLSWIEGPLQDHIVKMESLNSAIPLTVVAKVFETPVKVVPQFNEAALTALKSSFPKIAPIAPLDGNDPNLIKYFSTYKSSIESINSIGYNAHIKSIRNKMNLDIEKLTPTSQTILAKPPAYDSNSGRWSAGSGAWKEVWAVRSTLSWIEGPLNDHIVKLESLK